MLDQWYRPLHLPMTLEQFHQLPRNPVYKYEYIDGQAWLTPRPRTFNALMHLAPQPALDLARIHGNSVGLRELAEADWAKLPNVFAAAFEHIPPFSALTQAERLHAATGCITQTRTGGDGPILEPACFVAAAPESGRIVGGILVTLIPRRAEGEWWDGYWDDPP